MAQFVIIDKKCIGCGYCASFAPDLFIMDEKTGKPSVIKNIFSTKEEVRAIISCCPVKAIKENSQL